MRALGWETGNETSCTRGGGPDGNGRLQGMQRDMTGGATLGRFSTLDSCGRNPPGLGPSGFKTGLYMLAGIRWLCVCVFEYPSNVHSRWSFCYSFLLLSSVGASMVEVRESVQAPQDMFLLKSDPPWHGRNTLSR